MFGAALGQAHDVYVAHEFEFHEVLDYDEGLEPLVDTVMLDAPLYG